MFDNGIVNKSIQTYLIKKKSVHFQGSVPCCDALSKNKAFWKKNQSAIFGPVPLRKHIYKYNVYF